MPAVIPLVAYAVAAAIPAIAAYAALISLAASVVVGAVEAQRAKRKAARSLESNMRDRTVTVRSAVEPHRCLVGRARVGGVVAFAASRSNGALNNELDLVVAFTGHQIDAVERYYFNDEALTVDGGGAVTSGRYAVSGPYNGFESLVVTGGAVTVTPVGTLTDVGAVVLASTVQGEPDLPLGWTRSGNLITVGAQHNGKTVHVSYVSTGSSVSYAYLAAFLGTSGQAADGYLVGAFPGVWTAAHQLRSRAYIRATLFHSQDVWVSGLPSPSIVGRGALCYDPRSATTAWTQNPALIIRWYLTASFGLGCSSAEIDDASFIAAANACDEYVTVNTALVSDTAAWNAQLDAAVAAGTWEKTSTNNYRQRRYTCNGAFDLDERPFDVLAMLKSSCAGVLSYTGSVWRLVAGVYQVPTVTITEDDLRDVPQITADPPRDELFNVVRGTFTGPVNSYTPTDFEPVKNATYATQDGGQEISTDIALPFTDDQLAAQRIAKIHLERARQGIVVALPLKLRAGALRLRPGDTFMLTFALAGWSSKVFRVEEWGLSEDLGVDIVAQEEAAASYDWNLGAATLTDAAPDTNLPDPFAIPAVPGLDATSGTDALLKLGDGTIQSRVRVTWTTIADPRIDRVEIEFRRASEPQFTPLAQARADARFAFIPDAQDGQIYIIRARCVSSFGPAGSWSTVVREVVGKSALPPDVSAFSVSVLADGTRRYSITAPVGVTDGASLRVKLVGGSSTNFAAMSEFRVLPYDVNQSVYVFESAEPDVGTWSFGVKLVDGSGNESATPALIVGAVLTRAPTTVVAVQNLCPDSDFTVDLGYAPGATFADARTLRGWSASTAGMTPNIGRNYAVGGAWNLGLGGAWMTDLTPVPGGYYFIYRNIRCVVGVEYELTVRAGAHRCATYLYLRWIGADGTTLISDAQGGPATQDAGNGILDSQTDIAAKPLLYRSGVAPAGAAYAQIILLKLSTNPGNTTSFAFWHQVMLCVKPAWSSVTSPVPWVPNNTNTVDGGSLTPGSVTDVLDDKPADSSVVWTNSNPAATPQFSINFSMVSYTNSTPAVVPVVVSWNARVSCTNTGLNYTDSYIYVSGGDVPYFAFLGESLTIEQEPVRKNFCGTTTLRVAPGATLVAQMWGRGERFSPGTSSTTFYWRDVALSIQGIRK